MSLHRVLSISRLPNATTRISNIERFRPRKWQTTKAGGSSGSLKVLLYTTTGLGIAGAGTVAYSLKEPSFKKKVGGYVPGFSYVVDLFGGSQKEEKFELVMKAEKRSKPVVVDNRKHVNTDKLPEPATPLIKDVNPTKPDSATVATVAVTETKPTEPHPTTAVNETTLSESTQESMTLVKEAINEDRPSITQEEEAVIVDVTQSSSPDTISASKQPAPTELKDAVVVELPPKEPLYPVDSAVSSVMEETVRVAEDMISEQVKDHQESQSLGEEWMQNTAEVDVELEEAFEAYKVLSGQVVEAQKAVIEAVKQHQENVTQVILNTGDNNETSIDTMADNVVSSEQAVQDKKKELTVVTEQHEDLITVLESIITTAEEVGLKSKAEEVMRYINSATADLDVFVTGIREAESSSEVLLNYQQETQKSRETLQKELGSVLPEGDLKQDAIILMQNRRIEILKQQLEKIEQEKGHSLAASLDDQKNKLEKHSEKKLSLSLERQKIQVEQSFDKMATDLAHEFDSELKEKLRLQSEAHTSHLTDALRAQAGQLGNLWSKELETKLMEQEGQYQTEISKAMAKLRGIESMVNTVANAGEVTRYQQTIRNVCDTLSGALEQANTNPQDRFTISKELTSLRKAAENDKFLLSVIDSIPKQASDDATGIQCEAGLQERFSKVYSVSKRVALVPAVGGGLGTYALSYLQSLLVFNLRGVNQNKEIESMDSFEVLSLANESMSKGNIEEAVWYLKHLKNESGRVARDWLNDARLYLETRQAIKLIQTYTAATNITFSGRQS